MVDEQAPSYEQKGNKFYFHFPDISLHAQVSRLHVNHNSSRCNILFTSTHEKAYPHILRDKVDLESAISRTKLSKELATRYKIGQNNIDFKGILEYIAITTLEEHEKGEPIIKLTSDDPYTPLEYLVYPIAPLNKPTIIFGDPGAGKSTLSLILGMTMGLPWDENPLGLKTMEKSKVALYLDYEADPEDMRRQLVMLTKNMGLPYFELHYRRCSAPLADDMEAIFNYIDEIAADCLIIDSTSLAAGDDLNRMDVATSYMRTLRQFGITSISLAHTSKDKESKKKSVLGSVLWEAGARSIWECRSEEEDNTLNVALFHRKANLSRKSAPLGYKIVFGGDGNDTYPVDIQWHDPKTVADFVERMGTPERVLQCLKDGGLKSTDDIFTELIDVKKNTLNQALTRLKKNKQIIGDKFGWGLLLTDDIIIQ